MTEHKTWTKEEFKAYLLIYAAQTDFKETNEELEFIESRFNKDIINKIHKEIAGYNDYQQIQIIIDHIKLHNFSQDELDDMFLQIKELYDSDGKFDILEQSRVYMLEKLLKVEEN
jgi:hypothetical protein